MKPGRNCPHCTLSCSSLHWSVSLSFCSFSYSGVYYNVLKLSVSDEQQYQLYSVYVLCTGRIGLRSLGNRRDLGEEEGRERERGRKEGEGGQYITHTLNKVDTAAWGELGLLEILS